MLGLNQPLLINILGHAAGALIFAIFLVLLYSGRGWSGLQGRYLSGLAAGLSLVWNLGSLVVLAWPGLPAPVLALVAATSFSVLSLLPAVLLQVSLEGTWPALVGAGYVLSTAAVAMHFWEIHGNGPALHQTALMVITVGFLILAAVAVAAPALRHRHGRIRSLASMCLALFAMSFVHFGSGHAGEAWSSELVVHHAGIPLALFVLLQDYRFVLLDAFVRFLTNALLAAILTGLVIAVAFRLVLVERIAQQQPLHEAILLISICLFLVFFAWLRNWVQAWLTRAIFHRGNVAGLVSRVKDAPAFSSEEQYVEWAAALIAAAVGTKECAVVAREELSTAVGLHVPVLAAALPEKWNWVVVVLPVRFGQDDVRLILLGRRHGGQRYFSEDLDTLRQAALEIAERLDTLRREEMNRLVSQAELRALQSQINPHFLFNALNTLYGTIPREAAGARRMVINLAEIFRYFLQSDRTFVPLAQEMQIVRAYLEVEQLRLGERLRVEFEVDDAALEVPVPVLSIQPLVENAIKHGVAQSSEPGYVRVRIERRGEQLNIVVENSNERPYASVTGTGVGLQNVRRRLEICYGPGATLRLAPDEQRTIAEISIPLTPR
uniref:Signal transduction histidine kinase, LytS n=1 Tax=Solibacter usitatus (strain Ellin6076) TaxID=234267 RepID=Q02A00_SOLUE